MVSPKRFSEEEIENMLSLWRSGLNYTQIAIKIDRHKSTVGSIVRRCMTPEDKIRATELLSNPKRISDSHVDEVMKKWRMGMKYDEIAEEVGCTRGEIAGTIGRNKNLDERTSKFRHVTYNSFHEKQVPVELGPMKLEALPIKGPPRPAQTFIGIHFRECQWISGAITPDDRCKCMAKTGAGRTYCPSHEAKAKRVNYNAQQ